MEFVCIEKMGGNWSKMGGFLANFRPFFAEMSLDLDLKN